MKFPRIKPFLRAQAYVTTITLVLLGAKFGFAYKSAEKTLSQVGGQVVDYLTAHVDGAEAVSLNGERFAFATMETKDSVEQVLSATEHACVDGSGNLQEEIGPLLEQAKKAHPKLGDIDAAKLTTFRRDSKVGKAVGDVTCFTRPRDDGKTPQHPGFVGRLERFAESLAMGDLGEAHYLKAERQEDGNTRILYVRSLSNLNLTNLFPEGGGDAPGRDPKDVARPPGSVRTLSATIERTGDGFYSYETPDAPNSVLTFYDSELKDKWEKMVLDESEPEIKLSRAYAQHDRAAYVTVEELDGGGSAVALILLANRNDAVSKVTK